MGRTGQGWTGARPGTAHSVRGTAQGVKTLSRCGNSKAISGSGIFGPLKVFQFHLERALSSGGDSWAETSLNGERVRNLSLAPRASDHPWGKGVQAEQAATTSGLAPFRPSSVLWGGGGGNCTGLENVLQKLNSRIFNPNAPDIFGGATSGWAPFTRRWFSLLHFCGHPESKL